MTAEDDSIRRIVRRMVRGETVDWESQDVAGSAIGGLKAIEKLSRLARSERSAIADLDSESASSAGLGPTRPPRAGLATWGPLELEQKIGEGSYGEVYRAHDPTLQIDVALKLWFPQWSANQAMDTFLHEARTLARIRHPNVLAVYGAASHDQRVGMWTELLRGETLEDSIGSRGVFGATEAALVGTELCRALAAVHGAGVVHRDVKTRNVMRVEGGRIVLMDFGSVTQPRSIDAKEENPFLVGTPLTMAPEQLEGGEVGPAADLYALGVLLYRLVSGRYPIEASSLEELAALHQRGAHQPLRDRRSDLPAEFIAIIERGLARDPRDRFPSAGAFERALLHFVRADDRPAPVEPGADGKNHNLPVPLTRFVGRERVLADCREVLGRARLLSLTGVAGCGKTRLALRLGEAELSSYASGVWFVDLAPLNAPARVALAVAHTLDVSEERGRTPIESLAAHIGQKTMLILLDNCEHVLAAASEVTVALLSSCPHLRFIATSREALGVPGEAVFAVPSLSLPEPSAKTAEAIGASEAVRLFVDCAAMARADFHLTDENSRAVSEICRRLDGIPLAIELAAARIRVLGPEEIQAKLEDRFRLLTGGSKWAVSRHRTLLETLAWSYDLLTEEERALLRRLSVFAGGWSIDAARSVCSRGGDSYEILELITHLVDKSLVVVDRPAAGASRYRLLETVREFALEKLNATDEGRETRDRHLDYFLAYVESIALDLRGGDQFGNALATCDAEHDNVLAALAWCEQGTGGATKALRIIGSFFPYWTNRAFFSLGLELALHALARTGAAGTTPERAKATFAAANLAFYRGDYALSREQGEACLELFRALDLKEGMVWALNVVANVHMIDGDFAGSRERCEQSLAISREIGYTRGIAIGLNNLANLAAEANDLEAALPLYRESVDLNRELGRQVALGLSLSNVAETCALLGRAAAGKEALIESLEIARQTRRQDHGEHAIGVAGLIAEGLGAWSVAARLLAAAEALRESTGVPLQPAETRARGSATERIVERLGRADFDAAWIEGRTLSFDASVEVALEWLEGATAL
jgi:non-specific serine/threonine protein kinase